MQIIKAESGSTHIETDLPSLNGLVIVDTHSDFAYTLEGGLFGDTVKNESLLLQLLVAFCLPLFCAKGKKKQEKYISSFKRLALQKHLR